MPILLCALCFRISRYLNPSILTSCFPKILYSLSFHHFYSTCFIHFATFYRRFPCIGRGMIHLRLHLMSTVSLIYPTSLRYASRCPKQSGPDPTTARAKLRLCLSSG